MDKRPFQRLHLVPPDMLMCGRYFSVQREDFRVQACKWLRKKLPIPGQNNPIGRNVTLYQWINEMNNRRTKKYEAVYLRITQFGHHLLPAVTGTCISGNARVIGLMQAIIS